MLKIYDSRFLSLLISFSLLIAPLPLTAMTEDIISQSHNSSYVYLGKELSNISTILSEIGALDDTFNSPLIRFNDDITKALYLVDHQDTADILAYAESVLYKKYKSLDSLKAQQMFHDLEYVVQQFLNGELCVDVDTYSDENSKRSYVNIITVKGLLSVNDEVVERITAVDLSATDAIIQNATIVNLSVTEPIVQNLSVTNLSAVEETITGTLSVTDEVIKNVLKFNDFVGGEYVGLKAPMTVPTSYTLSLPSASPSAGQFLRANNVTPTDLEWATLGGSISPVLSKTIYVTKFGNDTTGNGSVASPYATLFKALSVANSIASSLNPISIQISSGIYMEDNSAGPLTITANGISIVGASSSSVIILPNTPTNNFLLANVSTHIANLTLQSAAPLATGITLTSGNLTILNNVRIFNFLLGADCLGGPTNSYGFTTCFFVNNGTGLRVNNSYVELNNSTFFGTSSLSGPFANNAITVTGAGANLAMSGGVCGVCITGLTIGGNAKASMSSVAFRLNEFDIMQNGASHLTLSGCTFELTTAASDVDLQISGAGTMTEIVSCEFSGSGLLGSPQGIAVNATDNASVNISGGSMYNYTTGIQVGVPSDTSSTNLSASALVIQNCTNDIVQQGSATLNFNASTASGNKIIINDETNVTLAFFDLNIKNALTIGSTANVDTTLIQAAVTPSDQPEIAYKSSLYSSQAIGLENFLTNPSSWFVLARNNASLDIITANRTDNSNICLISDEGSPIGTTSALRGWKMSKNGSSAELLFNYQNSDSSGQSLISEYTVMQLDGVNNQVQLPTTGTQFLFGGDTNLYRSAANTLKTDDNFVVGTLTPNRAVATDPVTNAFISSTATNTELGYLSGVTSLIQPQLNNKVSKTGDSMTGTLNMLTQNEIRFQDAIGNYIGMHAPLSVPSSYTVSLPNTVPVGHQVMRTNSTIPTELEWFTPGGSTLPASSKTIYVAKFGNDTTGDGSFGSPYASLSKAINIANTLATALNPICILISAGIYVENNSAGPLTVTANGISIVGDTTTGVVVMPSTPANNLLLLNTTVRIADLTFQSSAPLATGVLMTTGNLSTYNSVRFVNFQTGASCSGGSTQLYGFSSCLFISNTIGLSINDCRVQTVGCSFFGTPSVLGSAVNTGVSATGSGANIVVDGGACGKCATGFDIANNATVTISATAFKLNKFDIIQAGASHLVVNGASFEITDGSTDVDIQISGTGTVAELVGCQLNGNSALGLPQGTCILVSDGASLDISSGSIKNYDTALQVGLPSDTSSTVAFVSGFTINNCTNDIVQQGSASLNFDAGIASSSKITINDPANVKLAYFDLANSNMLTIGSTSDINTGLISTSIGSGVDPSIQYKSSLYSSQAIGMSNPSANPSSLYVTSNNNADLTAIAKDRSFIAGVRLVSDTASPIGGVTALRGWDINKNASTAELSFKYQNSDVSGQPVIAQYTVMQLDGVNNQVQLPTAATQVVFGGDTNLYRSATNTLKTDDNLIVGTLTPNRAVATDPVTNAFISSTATSTELGYLSGVTSPLQAQLNNKVSRSGDSMTGTLNMLTQNEIRFQDAIGNYVGMRAPLSVPSSYTLTLPEDVPVVGQTLRTGAVTPTNLEWVTEGGSITPAVSETIYVTQYGDDINGNGSFDRPYASLAQAITTANSLASSFNPIVIFMGPGIYVEDNSAGPLIINTDGISIVGDSKSAATIIPTTLSNDFLLMNNTVNVNNLTILASGVSTAAGVSLAAGNFSTFNNVTVMNFQVGALCAGGSNSIYEFSNCLFFGNGTGISINDSAVQCNNCLIFGSLTVPVNTGISTVGANAYCTLSGGSFVLCAIAMDIGSNTISTTLNAAVFKYNSINILQTGASKSIISGCNFEITNSPTDITMHISGAGTVATLVGCEFNGNSSLGVPQATALFVHEDASVAISSTRFENYSTAIQLGFPTDTSSTKITATGITIRNCTNDVIQDGSALLNLNGSTLASSKIIVNDSTNITLAIFDLDDDNTLTIGSLSDIDTSLVQAATNTTTHPEIQYKASLYSTQAMGFYNPLSNPSSWFIQSLDNADLTSVTTDRTKTSGIRLVSDTGSPVGGTSALRGWDINKNATSAELSFTYQNSDIVGQSAVSPYVVMQLDGVNNQLQLPTAATQIVFDTDTNLYRSAANVLKTDDNFIVGTLIPGRAVITDPITNQLASSVTTSTELANLSGTLSAIQAQLNNKVNKSGDTMTGSLQLPAGTTALPSLVFTGSTTSGLSASAGDLSFSTNAIERLKIANSGTISIDAFTSAGIVHNDSSGNLSSSLIVNADVAAGAAIVDTKLATISTAGKVANSATTATSANTASAIVARDASGNFSAGTITANLSGNATTATTATNFSGSLSGDVTGTQSATVVSTVGGQTASNVAAATVLANAATSANTASTIVRRTASGDFSAGAISVTDAVISNSATITPFNTAGVVHNDSSGLLSSSLIVNADVAAGAAIVDTKLATISTAGKVANSATTATSANTASAIVTRDASGNFSAGTITANLSGNATTATTATNFSGSLSGDVTGTQSATVVSTVGGQTASNVAAATVLANAATSANTASTIVRRTASGNFSAGEISVTDAVISNSATITPFNTAGVVHNDSSGLLSSSLIVNADIDSAAAIVDTKLATISTAGKVANSATTATSANTASAIVARDASGNFSAGTITANLSGNATTATTATNFSGSLSGDVTGTQGATVVSTVGGQTAANVAAATVLANAATSANTASTIVRRTASGDFSAGTISVTDAVISNNATITPFNTAGVVHNDSSGLLSSSLIVNADITNATISNAKLATISSSNTPGNIVVRDGSGNFATNMITIAGTTTSATDVATKAYVDSVAGTGLMVKDPAVVVSTSNETLSGLPTIDGVTLIANDRVLLAGQTDPIENGLWVVAAGAWSRPADFASGSTAGQAYILILSGTVYGGSSWLCNTPTATIDTDPVSFALFSLPNTTTGANVGTGTGLIFRDTTGSTLNFKTLTEDNHIVITNNANDITLATDATSANTASTIVARDASGNFSAGTITANLSGNATTATTATNFSGSLSGDVTGTQSATVVSTVGGQTAANVAAATVLANAATSANTASTIVRRTASGNFSAGEISVTDAVISNSATITPFGTAGVVHNNSSGLLSSSLIVNADVAAGAAIVDTKLATISTAGKVANSATTATSANTASAIVARDASGNFSAGTITANLSGNATTATTATNFSGSLSGDVTGTQSATVVSTVGGQTAANVAAATVLANAATSANTASTIVRRTASGNFSAGEISVTDAVISNSATIIPFNTAGVVHNDSSGLLSSSLIVNADIDSAAAIADTKLATISTAGKVANSATTATSANTASAIVARDASGNFSAGTITANLSGNATTATTATNFSGSLSGDVTGTQSATVVSTVGGQTAANVAAATVLANAATSANTASTIVRRTASGDFSAGTISVTDGVISNSATITPFNTAGVVHNDSSGLLSSSLIVNADIDSAAAIADTKLATISTAGKVANSATTATSANTASAIVARDASGNFSAGTITANLTGAASANVLKAGDTMTGTLIMPAGSAASPSIKFTGSTNTGFSAATADTLSFDVNGIERLNISSSGVTIDGFGTAGVVHNDSSGLLSSSLIVNADVSASAAIVDTKLATISTAGKVANSATTATSANTANAIVARDASGNFNAGTVVASLTGAASLNVLKAGDTMTGALQLPAGTTALPSLIFTGSTTTGLSTSAGALSFSTNALERMKISSGGTVSVNAFTSAGVVHNDASGNLSSSLVVNADVDSAAAIVDTKLATISTAGKVANSATTATSANTANAIVARDNSGNFSAGTITANLTGNVTGNVTGSASLNVLKAGDIMTGALQLPAGSAAAPSLKFTGSTNTGLSAATADILSFDINGAEQMNISSSGVTIDGFTTAGVVHNSAAGLLSSSLIVNADVDPAAAIVDTKLATISTAGKVANSATTATSVNTANTIVARDASGNFSAGTISASLTGAASLNVLKAGDTMTGTLQLPAGTTALPSLVFTGSTTTGLSTNASALSFSTNALERMKISSGGTVSINAFTGAGVVHNDSSGNLSSSLITNSDIIAAAGIVDTKLATISTAGKVANSATTATSANTASAIVARDASGNFSAGTITANLIGNVTGNVTGSASLNVLKAGDTMTGTLILPAGTAASPSLKFTGSTNTGLSAATADTLSFDINGTEQMNISSSGVTIDGFGTAGIVHNNSSGLLSSSLIVNADVDAAAGIVDTKLATISTAGKVANSATTATSANTANAIVARDSSGNFSAGTIAASLTGAASLNVLKAGDTMTGVLQLPAGTTALPSLIFTGSTTTGLSASSGALSLSTAGIERLKIASGGTVSINAFTSAGVIHNDSSGNLSSSLIVNADVDPAAAIVDTKLATISTAGKVANSATTATSANTASAIVARDGSGNFSAGTITASLTGSASNNVLKAGDIMTGTLQLPAGTTSAPALTFTGAITTGLSAGANSLSLSTAGSERLKIASGGTISVNAFTSAGIVHNDASGNLSSSLIVNADVDPAAAIVDTKFATISTAGKVANSATTATSANTASAIVARDGSGNFSTNMITLNGTTTNPTDAATKSYVDAQIGSTGTNVNTPNTLVKRDSTGSFAAQVISMTDSVQSGNLILSTEPSTSTAGNIIKGSSRFIHDFGTNNTFAGINAGNFTMSGSGGNSGFGTNALTANSTGAFNTAIGFSTLAANTIGTRNTALGYNALAVSTTGNDNTAIGYNALTSNATGTSNNTAIGSTALTANTTGTNNTALGFNTLPAVTTGSTNIAIGSGAGGTLTTGSGNIYINASAGAAAEATTTRIGTSQTACFVQGIFGATTPTGTPALVAIDSTGKLGTATLTSTSANTANTIVQRSASGGFSAGAISVTDAVISSSATVTPFSTAGVVHNNSSGLLSSSLIVNADVDPAAAIVDTKLATISTAGKVANSATTATSANTASAIVARDGSGNFTTNMITLNGTTTNATDAATKAYVDAQVGGTNLNTPNTTVKRDNTGSFAAQVVSVVDTVASGNLILSTEPSTSTAGNIIKGSSRFIHDFGTDNLFMGLNAGNFTTTGNNNIAIGRSTLTVITSGNENTAVGSLALTANTTGSFNTAVGNSALASNTTGTANTAMGRLALQNNTIGTQNTAVGFNALQLNTTGQNNTGIGQGTLSNNVTGSDSTAIGNLALNANTVSGNTAVGNRSLTANTTGANNTAIGASALAANTTGSDNTAIGASALVVNSIGNFNTAVGYSALQSNTTGSSNTAVGRLALQNNTTGTQNTAIGFNALQLTTIGQNNTAIGQSALANNVTGNDCTAIGNLALNVNTVSNNTAIGSSALAANTTGANNTAVGRSSLAANTTGTNNTAIGASTLAVNTIGTALTAVGNNSLAANTTGINNTAVGSSSLAANTIGVRNTALGASALAVSTTGTDNTAIGFNALAVNATGTSNNTAVGSSALAANTTGTSNTAIGFNALANNVTGNNNTAIGNLALNANTASGNTAIGVSALAANTTGLFNTAIGRSSLAANTIGVNNTAIGFNALAANTTGIDNTSIGNASLAANTIGTQNTALGSVSLAVNSTGNFNTAVGFSALQSNTTGSSNTAIGRLALQNNTTGNQNTAVGFNALQLTTTGQNNTAIGQSALANNVTGSDSTAIGNLALSTNTVSNNTAIGSSALAANTTGANNTAVGRSSLAANTIGTNNTALGANALAVSTTGTDNTAIGFNALAANATGTSSSTAVGSSALAANTTGINNTAVGASALAVNTIGTANTAVGKSSLAANTTGANNTAIGFAALGATTIGTNNTAVGVNSITTNTTGINNTALGSSSLQFNTTGINNTAIGLQALQANTIGNNNSALGVLALSVNTTGIQNTAIGFNALTANTTGSNNTALGYNSLAAVTTGSTNIAIGSGAGGTLTTGSGNIYIDANAGASNEATTTRIGTSQTQCFVAGVAGVGVGNTSQSTAMRVNNTTGQIGIQSSSRRFKHDIQDMDEASANIYKLRPVNFIYNNDETNEKQYGLIAEEVDEVLPAIVSKDANNLPLSVNYDVLSVLLVKEMQRQQIIIEELKKDNVQRDAIIQNLLERIKSLEAQA